MKRHISNRKTAIFFVILVFILILSRGEKANASGIQATIAASSGVNLRSEPGLSGAVISKIPDKELVEISGKSWDTEVIETKTAYWYMVSWNEKNGWIFGEYLKFSDEKQKESVQEVGIPMMETGTQFHGEEIDAKTGEEWHGLFPQKDGYVWKKVKVRISATHDVVVDADNEKTGKEVKTDSLKGSLFLSYHYNVSQKMLFLSSRAKKGNLVKKAAMFVTVGC